ncbi:TrmH family RNA methyltransferase [Cellulomonas phragmiteti]|uniref:rRNA methyltransferase n=1 Tax=Cellulomonas phragmiteti TaxID=478780 RepID=A0ABQ4DJK9_9CELL|nr:RNA methyltransferase [Cellulomonas phragmiteti]GIG39527.1 rRNA methyltransferase [Cellulomonas phragmiteti]
MSRADVQPVTDRDDPRLSDYVALTDVALRTRVEPANGLYIAESSTVLGRALRAGHRPRSVLLAPRWLPDLEAMLADVPGDDAVPVYVADEPVLEAITGFHVHRGALAAMHRPDLPTVADVLAPARGGAGARRVAIFDGMVDHTNLGAAFRSAAALGVQAVLVTPTSADPLYRRAVRVSMGTVFQVPWTRIADWPGEMDTLHELGFTTAAMALSDDAITLDELVEEQHEHLALVFGSEGHGLPASTLERVRRVVRIPMAGGVDSLNVAAAAAVAFYATRVV